MESFTSFFKKCSENPSKNIILSEQNDFLNLTKIETALEYLSFTYALRTAEEFGNSLAEVYN